MKRSIILAATVVALLGLTACAPHPAPSSNAHAGPTRSATPTPTPTPTVPPLPADVLFRISVTATAPNGAVAKLTETVHAPVATTDQQSADEAQLDNECDSWRSAFSSTQFLVGQVQAILVSGSWDPNQIIVADMAGYPVWQGDERPFQAFCADALPNIPGGARAVSPVGGGPDVDKDGGWGIYRYGFEVSTDGSTDDSAASARVVLSNCGIQLGAAAHSSVFASSWPASPQTNNGLACTFGGS